MKIGVKILPRNEVLDSQGRAVTETLRHRGQEILGCRVGKYVVLDIPSSHRAQAMAKAKEIADDVLHNPLIENYELEELAK